jgi:hypothetical protein
MALGDLAWISSWQPAKGHRSSGLPCGLTGRSPLVTPGGLELVFYQNDTHRRLPRSSHLSRFPSSLIRTAGVSSFVTPPSHFSVTPGFLNLKVPSHTLSSL